eukprot:m.562062 g.562062  ORF g.562062 m.562062 type:complete len:145 (-) comp57797_c0_seq2:179-613(-)
MSCFSHSPLCLDLNLDFLSRHPRLSSRSVLAKGASSPRGSMSPAPAAGAAKPRVLRFTFGMQSTSAKPCDDMLLEVKRVLAQNAVSYKLTEPFLLVCNHGSVQFEMEICHLPRLSLNGVRHKRIAGTSIGYKNICTKIVSELNL